MKKKILMLLIVNALTNVGCVAFTGYWDYPAFKYYDPCDQRIKRAYILTDVDVVKAALCMR